MTNVEGHVCGGILFTTGGDGGGGAAAGAYVRRRRLVEGLGPAVAACMCVAAGQARPHGRRGARPRRPAKK